MPIVLAGFAAFVVALVALVALFGLAKIADITTKPLTGIPVIGAVRSAILRGIGTAVNFWSPWLRLAATSITTWIRTLWQHHSTSNAAAQSAAGAIAGRMHGIVHHDIPAAKATAIKWGGVQAYRAGVNAVHDARLYTDTVWNHLQANINAANAALATDARQLAAGTAAASAALNARIDAVDRSLSTAIDGLAVSIDAALRTIDSAQAAQLGALRTSLLAELSDVAGYARTVAGAVAAFATTAAGQAESHAAGYADASAAAAVAGLWPGVAAPAEQARQGVSVEAPGVLSGAPAIPQVAPSTLTGVLAAVATMAATATTYVDECGLGLCANLSTVARLLGGIAEVGLVAELVAIAAEAVTDPNGATSRLHDLAAGPAEAVLPLVGAAFGVRLAAP